MAVNPQDVLGPVQKAAGAYNPQQVNLLSVIGNYIQLALGFMGMVVLLIVIYSGWLWMTAQGDEGKVEKAKEMIKNAAVGLVIISLAYSITGFVIGSLNGPAQQSNTGFGNVVNSF